MCTKTFNSETAEFFNITREQIKQDLPTLIQQHILYWKKDFEGFPWKDLIAEISKTIIKKIETDEFFETFIDLLEKKFSQESLKEINGFLTSADIKKVNLMFQEYIPELSLEVQKIVRKEIV